MWNYRRKECDEDRKLRLNEYSSPFLRWAQLYLQHNPAFVMRQVVSSGPPESEDHWASKRYSSKDSGGQARGEASEAH